MRKEKAAREGQVLTEATKGAAKAAQEARGERVVMRERAAMVGREAAMVGREASMGERAAMVEREATMVVVMEERVVRGARVAGATDVTVVVLEEVKVEEAVRKVEEGVLEAMAESVVAEGTMVGATMAEGPGGLKRVARSL